MKKSTIYLLSLLFLYFVTRLLNLTLLPIFNDESTYIRYGLHQLLEKNHAPYSLLIGKEPLMPFLYAVFGTFFSNLLIGSRLVTVVVGFITLTGIYLTTKEFFHKHEALFASLFYILVPYTLFFDRLALMDSAVNAIAVWSLYLTLSFLKKQSFKNMLLVGLVMGIGMWTKTSALFYVVLPSIMISFAAFTEWKKHNDSDKLTALMIRLAGILFIVFLVVIPLISNDFYMIHLQLLKQYTYPLSSIFQFPISIWVRNAISVFEWLFFYLTPPLFLLILFGLYKHWKNKKLLSLLLWFILPCLYEILYAKMFTSRHALSLTIPLFIYGGAAMAHLLEKKKTKTVAYILIGLVAIWSGYSDSVLLFNPMQYPSVYPDRAHDDLVSYVSGFSSGYGVKEAIRYLLDQAKNGPIIVVIRNDHGNPEDAVVAYLYYQKNIKVYPLTDTVNQIGEIFKIAKGPVYAVSRGQDYGGLEKYFVKQFVFSKPHDTEFIGVQLLDNTAK